MSPQPSYAELVQRIKELENETAAYNDRKKVLEADQYQLAQIVSGSPIPTFVINRDHILTHFNQACENLTGILARNVIGSRKQWKAFYAEKRPVMADFILDGASDTKIAEYYYGKYRPSNVIIGAYEAEDYFPALGLTGKWLFFTAAPIKNQDNQIIAAIETLQDITLEKISTMRNQALLRISQALHEHTTLESLLDYISSEVKYLLGTEGALVILLDEDTQELYFKGSAYDNPSTGQRVKEVKFGLDQLVAGQVIRSGQPLIINDSATVPPYPVRDQRMGYQIHNLIEVPIQAGDRIIGVLNANNKLEGQFGPQDIDLLRMIAGTVDLAIENARISDELKAAYKEVSSLNTAKSKVINHLSHELKTPVAALSGAISMLEDELKAIPEEEWRPLLDIAIRNMNRVVAIQEEVADIMEQKSYSSQDMVLHLLEQSQDLLATLIAQESKQGNLTGIIKKRVAEIFHVPESEPTQIDLKAFIETRLADLRPQFTNRHLEITPDLTEGLFITMPEPPLVKVIDGLIKNAVENTPDEGRIVLRLCLEGAKIIFVVHDYGVGIADEFQQRIFEGFFPTQGLTQYSTKKPFDFNAGGKGADLLRMKIFSEKYGFRITMKSCHCPQIETTQGGRCPGGISKCTACQSPTDCHQNGETMFSLEFKKS